MEERYLVGLTLILVLGAAARWLAWRLHLPAILLLLLCGIVAGPVTGFLQPDELFTVARRAALQVVAFEHGFVAIPRAALVQRIVAVKPPYDPESLPLVGPGASGP